jgi:hypothetical protein
MKNDIFTRLHSFFLIFILLILFHAIVQKVTFKIFMRNAINLQLVNPEKQDNILTISEIILITT